MSDALLAADDRLGEFAALGEHPGHVAAGDRRRKPVESEALAHQIAFEQAHGLPEALVGRAELGRRRRSAAPR